MGIIRDIIDKADKIKTLEIKTIIGEFSLNSDGKINFDSDNSKTKAIITQIDLLEGDITTALHEKFLEAPYNKIREFHADREKDGRDIIEKNIKS